MLNHPHDFYITSMMQWSSIFGVVLVFSRVFLSDGAIDKHEDKRVSLNIAVVGAGPAGIVTAKHCVDGGHNVTVYEQNKELGGVWVYTDEIGKNQYGLNIHTAMYKGLRYVFLFSCFVLAHF